MNVERRLYFHTQRRTLCLTKAQKKHLKLLDRNYSSKKPKEFSQRVVKQDGTLVGWIVGLEYSDGVKPVTKIHESFMPALEAVDNKKYKVVSEALKAIEKCYCDKRAGQ